MWKNIVEPGRLQMTIQRMRSSCWIPKATVIYSEYVILFGFSTATTVSRTRLNVMLLFYTHIASLGNFKLC